MAVKDHTNKKASKNDAESIPSTIPTLLTIESELQIAGKMDAQPSGSRKT